MSISTIPEAFAHWQQLDARRSAIVEHAENFDLMHDQTINYSAVIRQMAYELPEFDWPANFRRSIVQFRWDLRRMRRELHEVKMSAVKAANGYFASSGLKAKWIEEAEKRGQQP